MIPPRSGWPSAFLFDLDGVLIDTRAIVRRNWLRFCEASGLVLDDADLPRIYGRRTVDILIDVFGFSPARAGEAAAAWIDAQAREAVAIGDLPSVPGAAEFVRATRAAGLPLAVASSALGANVRAALAAMGLEAVVGVVVSADDVERGKPDPEPYQRAAAAIGADPTEAIVFEDTPAGVTAARAAGAACVALSTTLDAGHFGGADLVLADFRGLTPATVIERVAAARRARAG